MKDLYNILSIQRNATDTDIKSAYKNLAFQYHPDKNKDQDAEDKFKDISEAYSILSKPEKRKQYDIFGYESMKNTKQDINPIELFQSLFNVDFMNGSMNNNIFFFSDLSTNIFPDNKPCLKYTLDITIDELYKGITKEFIIPHIVKNNKKKETKYVINIKKGTKNKENIIVKDGGNYIEDLDMTEDLFIEINELPNDRYQRKGNDIYIEHEISLIDSLCGCSFTIQYFDELLTIEINSMIKPNTMYKVFGKGMPIKPEEDLLTGNGDEGNNYGDLIIDFKIKYPDELSDEQKEYLKNILGMNKNETSNDIVQAYYYKDKEDVIKEIMNEEEEESSGCIQQ